MQELASQSESYTLISLNKQEEEEVCAATSQLEDFVLTFMERCFALVDMSVLESTRLEQSDPNRQQRSLLENMAESAIASSFNCILVQTSPQIFKVSEFTLNHLLC